MNGNNKQLAFTLAEIMITLVITSIILAATYSIGKQKIDTYDTRYMYYATFMSLKEALADMKADGCIAADVTNNVCQNTSMLPGLGHTSDSRGFCDRLASYYNVVGANNCNAAIVNPLTQINSGTTPNFTASNGARFYNLNSPSDAITLQFFYVDYDGPRGRTKYGKDLTCFQVNLITGGVIPCLGSNFSVGTSTDYLSMSVYYMDKATNAKVYTHENIPFCPAACYAYGGKLWGNDFSGSCSSLSDCGGWSFPQDAQCADGKCEIEINKPSFFWGK